MILAGCGGSGSTVAQVGTTTLTKTDLADAVDHFKQEAEAEGRTFPDPGTDAYHNAERQALGLLVYRAELLQAADKLGVGVSESEVETRLAGAGEESGEAGRFARDTVRAQLAYEHIYQKVTAALPAARQGDAIRRWLERMKRSYEVSYEEGYATSS
jgi:SurA-like N-terminal domain